MNNLLEIFPINSEHINLREIFALKHIKSVSVYHPYLFGLKKGYKEINLGSVLSSDWIIDDLTHLS